jgi:hypothetical protein
MQHQLIKSIRIGAELDESAAHNIQTIVADIDNTLAKTNERIDERLLSELINFIQKDSHNRKVIIISDDKEGSLEKRIVSVIPEGLRRNFVFAEVGGCSTFYYDNIGNKVYIYDLQRLAKNLKKDFRAIRQALTSVLGENAFIETTSPEHISSYRKTFILNESTQQPLYSYVPKIKYELARRGLEYSVYLSGRRTLRISAVDKGKVLRRLKRIFNLDRENMLLLGDGGLIYHSDYYMWSYPREGIKVNVGMRYSAPMFEGANYVYLQDAFLNGSLSILRFLNNRGGKISVSELKQHTLNISNEVENTDTVKGKFVSFINNNMDVVRSVLTNGQVDTLIRIPVEAIESVGIDNIKDFLATFQEAPNGYVELYYMSGVGEVSETTYQKYGLQKKPLPKDFKRNRENTITLFPALKGEEINQSAIVSRLGDFNVTPDNTILSPIGLQHDPAGLIRATILGLKIMDIARQIKEKGIDITKDQAFKDKIQLEILEQLKNACDIDDLKNFNLTPDDIIALATGNINNIITALKKLIKLLPITPINAEELRQIYEHAKLVVTAA